MDWNRDPICRRPPLDFAFSVLVDAIAFTSSEGFSSGYCRCIPKVFSIDNCSCRYPLKVLDQEVDGLVKGDYSVLSKFPPLLPASKLNYRLSRYPVQRRSHLDASPIPLSHFSWQHRRVSVSLVFVSGVYLRTSHHRSSDGDTSTVRLRLN
ncbi:hypothetical protein BP00DRAFT_268239 [Aspergillus indologenus CBS 114.80]|uniref:Uncharacterized protein n=1 Tax=Aspergillus indologenus CBS 114.80 TaxID=1450541 RepID=A0A2V5IET4_9EURO|nr:hypothetical protein BP00DRAFT_268239 [Aspergillus indologenus CBS 114.80]